jgi:hypothetical protein
MTSQTNFGAALDPAASVHAQLAVKDEYTFAFLDLEDAHSERELERALTERIGAFLQEMGNMFAFVGSQYKIQVGERDFFIDLLLYHRQLRALVALELKIGEFEPEYIGKMQFYLSVLDDTVRLPEEQPSIGIILCKSFNTTQKSLTSSCHEQNTLFCFLLLILWSLATIRYKLGHIAGID